MHIILTYDIFDNPYLKGVAGFSDQLSRPKTNISLENLIAILRDKYKMLLNPENRMTALPVFHCGISSSTQRGQSIIAKAGSFNLERLMNLTGRTVVYR